MPRIKVPSEPYYGAKFLLAPDVLNLAPIKSGRKFIDLCSGRGSLTFRAWAMDFRFKEWVMNDPNTARFFEAVRDIGHNIKVPPRSRDEFERQKALSLRGDKRAALLEAWLSFNGGNYTCGGSHGQSKNGGRRTPEAEEKNLRLMHEQINQHQPRISRDDWLVCLEREQPGKDDLVVIDYPYIDCKTGAYDSEDVLPIEVIAWAKNHPDCNFILCEFDQPIYRHAFGPPAFQKEVQLRAVNLQNVPAKRRVECVWTSFSYKAHLAKSDATATQVLHATLRDPKDYQSLTISEVLKELRVVADKIEKNKLQVSAEERQRMLPLLIILKKKTKRKRPGYHKLLASIGLNASTVRSWFYRGQHTDEIIAMLEPKPTSPHFPATAKTDERRGGNAVEDAADLTQRFLMRADEIVSALLRGQIILAQRLARDYAEARKIPIGTEARQQLKKAA